MKKKLAGEAIVYLIDSILIKDFPPYSICGSLNNYMNDSIFNNILFKFERDSIIPKGESEYFLSQFKIPKYLEINQIIDTSEFYIIHNIDKYSNKDFYNVHIVFSNPLFSKDRTICIVYTTGIITKGGVSDVFFILKRRKNQWRLIFQINNKYPINFPEYHYHNYSLVKPAYLDADK